MNPLNSPFLRFLQHNDIPVLHFSHPNIGEAEIALQGAHLMKWQPKNEQEVLWLSEIEPFKLGNAIRGGVPICYPWFGGVKTPSHGTARIRLWHLISHDITENVAELTFGLLSEDGLRLIAKITMRFSAELCQLTFQHLDFEPAQVALHSYFKVADIRQTEVQNLPESCFNSLTRETQNVPSTRIIGENVDCIYRVEHEAVNVIADKGHQREIVISHLNASNVVLWNPWHKATSGMSESGYQTMVCVETARLEEQLSYQDSVSFEIRVRPASGSK